MNTSHKKIFKAMSLFGGVQGISIVLNLARTWLAANLIGTAGVGLNAIYNETRELLHSTTNFGLDISGVRGITKAFEQKDQEAIRMEIRLLRSWVLILAMAGTLLTILLAQPLSYFTFDDSEHVWSLIMLSPAIGMATITCGEVAVLTGTRKLRLLATISLLNVVASILISVPIYYFWGIQGVLPSLIVLGLVLMLIPMAISYKLYRPEFCFNIAHLRVGLPMLSVGLAFVATNVIDHVVQLCVQSYMNTHESISTVGLYQAGYTITMTFIGIFVASLGSDYFPRLTAIIDQPEKNRKLINEQTEAILLLMAPATIVLIATLPLIIRILFNEEFAEAVPMARVALIGIFLRAAQLPFSYIPLAKGDSRTYMVINTFMAIDVLLTIVGFYYGGLLGAGIAIALTHLIDLGCSWGCASLRYHILPSRRLAGFVFLQLTAIIGTYACTYVLKGWLVYACISLLLIISTGISYIYMKITPKE